MAFLNSCVGITCSSSGVLRSASILTAENCMQEQQDPKAASAEQLPQIREDCIPVRGKAAVCVHIPSSVQDAQNSQWLWQANEKLHGFPGQKSGEQFDTCNCILLHSV